MDLSCLVRPILPIKNTFKQHIEIIDNIKIAEFEPGIIDAYCGEDKFYDLLKWMNGKKFFLNSLNVEPVYRLKTETV